MSDASKFKDSEGTLVNVKDAQARADIATINSSLTQKTKVKEKTVTGTTNSYGAIGLGLYWATNEIISVTPSDNTTYAIPFTIGLSYYVRVLQDGSTWTPKGNTAVTLTVRYREYTVSP